MDQQDEESEKGIYEQLKSVYSQLDWVSLTNSSRSRNSQYQMHSPFVSEISETGDRDSELHTDGADLSPGIEEQPLWPVSYDSERAEIGETSAPWTPPPPYSYTGGHSVYGRATMPVSEILHGRTRQVFTENVWHMTMKAENLQEQM